MDDLGTAVQPEPKAAEPDLARFDRDAEVLAWARGKIQSYIDRATGFEQHCHDTGLPEAEARWRTVRQFMRQTLIGGRGCVIAAFDERLPEMTRLVDGEVQR